MASGEWREASLAGAIDGSIRRCQLARLATGHCHSPLFTGPLNRFMAASMPWVTQTATAWEARIKASSITAVRGCGTGSARSRRRRARPGRRCRCGAGGTASVPRWAAMSRSPFWPPSEPPGRIRNLPTGRLRSSQTTRMSCRFELVEPDDLADRPTAQVHERLGLQEQDAAVVDLGLGDLAVELAAEPASRPPRASCRRARSRCCGGSPGI